MSILLMFNGVIIMNYSKMTKAQLIEIINGLQDELVHTQKDVSKAEDSSIAWDAFKASQVQAKTTTHAEIMRVRMAAAKAQAMASGRAVKA